jgi:hypothetical protein
MRDQKVRMRPMDQREKLEALLIGTLGMPFLRYVLNASDEEIGSRLTENNQLPSKKEESLSVLLALLSQLGSIDPQNDPLWYLNLDVFGLHPEQGGHTSWANTLRENAEGAVPPHSTGKDTVKNVMSLYASELYALFLLPKSPDRFDPFHPSLSRPVFTHPRKDELEKAVLDDKLLGSMFPNREQSIPSGMYMSSSGHGGGIQLATLPETLLKNAWRLASSEHDTPSVEQLIDATMRTIDTLRTALTEKGAEIPLKIGLAGVVLDGVSEIKLPWGRLRPATAADFALLPSGINTQSTHTFSDGSTTMSDSMGNLVFETTIPYKVIVVDKLEGPWPKELNTYDEIFKRIESMQTGLLLSQDAKEGFPKAVFTWRSDLDPVSFSAGISWSDPKAMPLWTPTKVDQDKAKAWRLWTDKINKRRVPSIEVAIHRLLRAVNERRDATDMLIDCVIAWESMVGSREGEPTLRVSTALAWLLETTKEKRIALQKQVKKLYGLRSDVVHGNRILDNEEVAKVYQEAIGITLDALRRLFDKRPELLSECRDSTERSNRLIVGG